MFAYVGRDQNLKDLKDYVEEILGDLLTNAKRIRHQTSKKESKVGVQMRLQILWTRIESRRTTTSISRINALITPKPEFLESGRNLGMLREAIRKTETTFMNQLSFLFHQCGLKFSAVSPTGQMAAPSASRGETLPHL